MYRQTSNEAIGFKIYKIVIIQSHTRSTKIFYQTATFGVPEYEIKPAGSSYKPVISPEHLSKLRLLKARTNRPITKLVSEALELYLAKIEKG